MVANAGEVALVAGGAGHIDAVIDACAYAIGADIVDSVGIAVIA